MDFFLCLQFPRSNVRSHSQTHIESHLNLALRGLEATQHQLHELVTVVKDQSQQIARQSRQIERQSQQIARQSQQIERQSQQIERQSGQIERQSQQIERQSQQIEQLMFKDKERSQQIERLMSTSQDRSQQLEPSQSKGKKQSKRGGRLMSTGATSYRPRQRVRRELINQMFEWKIPNIENVLANAEAGFGEVLVSEPFTLFEHGYKYLLRFETALEGPMGFDVMLLVFIKIVPGEFDELLLWPCKEKVRVTLVDQDALMDNGKNISSVIDFEKGVEPCSRPLHDDHYKYRCILEVSNLQSRSYIKDDTILIKATRE